jgi:hypothetical protein
MQLGSRWTFGETPPSRLPASVVVGIAEVEAEIRSLTVDASAWRWTLTYLEGRPICELDDGTLVEIDAAGRVTITEAES